MTSTGSPLSSTEHLLRENNIFGHGRELLDLIGKNSFSVVYDSKVNGFNKGAFGASVVGKKDIVTLIFTREGHIFGAYHSYIPSIPSFQVAIDANAFIFSLTNKLQTFKHIDSGSFFNGNQPIYEVSCAFKIFDSSKQSFVCAYANRYYSGLDNSNVIAGDDTFVATQLIALELH